MSSTTWQSAASDRLAEPVGPVATAVRPCSCSLFPFPSLPYDLLLHAFLRSCWRINCGTFQGQIGEKHVRVIGGLDVCSRDLLKPSLFRCLGAPHVGNHSGRQVYELLLVHSPQPDPRLSKLLHLLQDLLGCNLGR